MIGRVRSTSVVDRVGRNGFLRPTFNPKGQTKGEVAPSPRVNAQIEHGKCLNHTRSWQQKTRSSSNTSHKCRHAPSRQLNWRSRYPGTEWGDGIPAHLCRGADAPGVGTEQTRRGEGVKKEIWKFQTSRGNREILLIPGLDTDTALGKPIPARLLMTSLTQRQSTSV